MLANVLFGVVSTATICAALVTAWRRAERPYRIVPYGLTLWSIAMLLAVLGWATEPAPSAGFQHVVSGFIFVCAGLAVSVALLLLAGGLTSGIGRHLPSSVRWLGGIVVVPILVLWLWAGYMATVLGISDLFDTCFALMDDGQCDIWAD